MIDKSLLCGKIQSICKDCAEAKQDRCHYSEWGYGVSSTAETCAPLPALPGMTGTGAPVTEPLRCSAIRSELGWYRE